MRDRTHILLALAAGLGSRAIPSAADLVVDPSGVSGPYTTIEAAMAAAHPGDRILVLPGDHPAFLFSKGVSVIGAGADPGAVRIDHVGYHPGTPTQGFDTLLSNVTVCGSGPADALSISGNELAAGTLVLHGVRTCGGVFLHGDAGFSLVVSDSAFDPAPGAGFGGAAFDFRGGSLDLVATRITGWDAEPASGIPAAAGLRLQGGVAARLVGSRVEGGDAGNEGPGTFEGAAAIAGGAGSAAVALVLAGDTLVQGGDGAIGGDGVVLSGTLEVGDAVIQGGAGATPGASFGGDPPIDLGFDPVLSVSPSAPFAAGPIAIGPGTEIVAALDGSLAGPVAIALSLGLDPPAPWIPTLLASPATLVLAPGLAWTTPALGGVFALQAYAQGFHVDPSKKTVRATNLVTIRMDL